MTDIVRFVGIACRTGVPYQVGSFEETVQKGAFRRTLAQKPGPDVQFLLGHGEAGSGMPIARTGVNMTLSEVEQGLRVEADLDMADPDVALLVRKVQSGLVDQMSMGFRADEQTWDESRTHRLLKSVNLHRGDVSVVGAAANEAARIESMTPAARRAKVETIGRDCRIYQPFTASVVEISPGPERRARGEVSRMEVHLEPRSTTTTWKPCARCAKSGSITLAGRKTKCPNCLGRGAAQVAVDGPHLSTSTDGSSRSRARQIDETRRLKALGIELRKRITNPAGGAGLSVGICKTCGGVGRLAKPNGGKRRCDTCAGSGRVVSGKLDPTKTTSPVPFVGARTLAEFGIEQRSDYSQDQLKAMWLKGEAYHDPDDGHFSFPTSTVAELLKAFSMVQLTGPEGKARESVRRYLIGRAKTMGQTDQLPDAWNSDGTIASSRAFHY